MKDEYGFDTPEEVADVERVVRTGKYAKKHNQEFYEKLKEIILADARWIFAIKQYVVNNPKYVHVFEINEKLSLDQTLERGLQKGPRMCPLQ